MSQSLWKCHGPVMAAGAVCILVNGQGIGPLWLTGIALLVVGMLMRWAMTRAQRPSGDEAPPLALDVPVEGRWMARNGPATKVPSHTHNLAQTYAIDLARRPAPEPVWFWPVARRPESYPSFGEPLLAPADGRVVAASDGQRDHLSRSSLAGLFYVLAEGFVRSLGLPRHLLGNHLVLELDDGVYAVFAHLRRHSLKVAVGDRVTAGRPLAECGNSGNSAEPHLHFQLMDGPDVTSARGLRFTWRYRDDDGREHDGVPADNTCFVPIRTTTADRPDPYAAP
ncbi:peptidoglycan DD-metalloendopeptidase family protein [Streptomyces sp. TRM43335]|uniref:Peptidoglycan DD-metalloendopeptidase family protein n=1 Tax=Streptomyces taklimakanensis TaxID=2569853 RepID=A0A6G2BBG5_9ACTN|nr:M23 family metallopeptidase [Streptomyces taklimakanensis]MTE19564.1 peptidoglycan DD-metalloendopeptidase family protein [Streptomyces taklimakanensis]